MTRVDFAFAIAALEGIRAETVASLRGGHTEALVRRKTELEDAIGCLRLCESHQLGPRANVVVLPETLTRSPSSEMRLIEDHETEQRQHWREVLVDGVAHRPSPGDLLILR